MKKRLLTIAAFLGLFGGISLGAGGWGCQVPPPGSGDCTMCLDR